MKEIRIATAQFQTRNGDKTYNLSRIGELTKEAADKGARIVSFHELSITSYSFLRKLSRGEILELAEEVPAGESVEQLIGIAGTCGVALLAGLVERDGGLDDVRGGPGTVPATAGAGRVDPCRQGQRVRQWHDARGDGREKVTR